MKYTAQQYISLQKQQCVYVIQYLHTWPLSCKEVDVSPTMTFIPAFLSSPTVFHQLTAPRAKCKQKRKHGSIAQNRSAARATISEPPGVERALSDEREEVDKSTFSWTEQWYVVCLECNAPVDEPFAFQLFDMELVLFRSAPGRWSVLDDRCSHRLAPLSEGRITQLPGDNSSERVLECAYHGWSFKSCGQCARIPQIEKGNSGATIPRRAGVRSYPTKAEHGIIWVWLGDPANADTKPIPAPPVMKDFTEEDQFVGFSRYVPYGYETFLENIADTEHTYYTHHGVSAAFNRANGGRENTYARQTGPETIVASRSKKGEPSNTAVDVAKFVAPGTVYYDVKAPGKVKLLAWFLVAPVTRTKSHAFAFFYSNLRRVSPLAHFLAKLKPTWLNHFEYNNTLDGDNVFLRVVQRNASDPSTWRDKYLPVGGFDGFVLELKKWLDVNRDAMPWKSDPSAENALFDELSREELNERYYSHTIHCKACKGALKGFERAAMVADWVANLGIVGIITVVMSAFVGNAAVIPRHAQMNTFVVCTGLVVLTVLALLARQSFLWFKAQFISSDEARRKMLEAPLAQTQP